MPLLCMHRLLLVYSQQTRPSRTIPTMNLTLQLTASHLKRRLMDRLSIFHQHVLERSLIRPWSVPQRAAVVPADRDLTLGFLLQSRSRMLHNSTYLLRQRQAFRMNQILGLQTDRTDLKALFSHVERAEALYQCQRSTYQRQSPIERVKPQAGRVSNRRSHLHDQCLRLRRLYFLRTHLRRIVAGLRRI